MFKFIASVVLTAGWVTVSSAQFQVAQIGGNRVGSLTNNGGGSYTVVGGGNDIWDQADEFTYAYQEVTGDFDVQVRSVLGEGNAGEGRFEDAARFLEQLFMGGLGINPVPLRKT
jgi:hypothetical protein